METSSEYENSGQKDIPFNIMDTKEEIRKSLIWPILQIVVSASVVVLGIIVILAVLGISLPFSIVFRMHSGTIASPDRSVFQCSGGCEYKIVETIPDQLIVNPTFSDTTQTWLEIINNSKERVRLVVFYWDMSNNVTNYGDNGNKIMDAIQKRAKEIKIQVVQYKHSNQFPDEPDLSNLRKWGVEIVEIDWESAFGGVLHTKMLIGDDKEFYIGSANMDWKALNQVKELGIHIKCECLTKDANIMFDKYYHLGTELKSSFKDFQGWPQKLMTAISMNTPLNAQFNNQDGTVFITAAPKLLANPGRTNDLDALRDTILTAKDHVYISVMDYMPLAFYGEPHHWWGEIDDTIRDAFVRGSNIKMLIGKWDHTANVQINGLRSLAHFGQNFCNNTLFNDKKWCNSTLEIRQYVVPDPIGYEKFPYTRVNHAKFMVTEKRAFISTSNWGKDYYYNTAGATLVSTHSNVIQDLETIFLRDWNSIYASPLPLI